VFHELCASVIPRVGLDRMMATWPAIVQGLAQSPRRRATQLNQARQVGLI